jgi:predicted  nucleic acid-binding Zn-ribbon protein
VLLLWVGIAYLALNLFVIFGQAWYLRTLDREVSDVREKLQLLEREIAMFDEGHEILQNEIKLLEEAIAEAVKGSDDFLEFQDNLDQELETRGII